jgi:hypothetical protein
MPRPPGATRWARVRPYVTALGAGAMHGSWAAWANRAAGREASLRAAATQATMSMAATLLLVLLLERLFRWPRSPAHGFWLAAVGTSSTSVAALVLAHALNGTPRIAVTIAPSVAIGTMFYFAYARMLLAAARK